MAYRLGWQSEDGRMSQVLMRFIFGVRPRRSPLEVLASIVGFSGVVTWSGDLLEGNILAIDISVYEDMEEVSSFVAAMSFSLDVPPWHSNGVLWQDVDRLVSQAWREPFVPLVLLGCFHWILHPLHGSILPRVFTCWIYLVGLASVCNSALGEYSS